MQTQSGNSIKVIASVYNFRPLLNFWLEFIDESESKISSGNMSKENVIYFGLNDQILDKSNN